ncbi:PREDICTED: 30S ribosomal protein 2, chloroplastic [Nicotiana attenuata]|uniref:Small ribosomal subunit protein cS22 n=1 Tax=Nicotiana attenuata TaxID=49451 RepID=A0A314LEK1_NICAT|nr:PREDICTED: 30S ribosomal protein 2, chloroplastic [Nicotiana attenuata]OIT40095.1 30s ribosomal protein 2, chloroplastic [Nicotiana attenuata]
MSTLSSFTISPTFLHNPRNRNRNRNPSIQLPNLSLKPQTALTFSRPRPRICLSTRMNAVAEEETSVSTTDPSSEAARRLYIGNIPRTLTPDELRKIVEEHAAVEKAEVMYDKYSGRSRRFGFVTMTTVEDASAAVEKLNGTEIGGREIKVNITEKPLSSVGSSLIQPDDSKFVDSPHKVYVGNLAKNVTSESLKNFFSEKGNVLSAKVSRVPGTSKSSGYGFVSFSSEEDVEAAISSLNNALLDGQKIRVNKA